MKYISSVFNPKILYTLRHYSKEQLGKDIIAGIIVAIIALPLSIALAISSGVSPEKGIYTAIIAGFLTSLFGGSRVQIGGSSLWTVTHSMDFAMAYIGLLGNPHAIGEPVHITSDESLTWNQIYEIIGQALGVKPKLVHISSDMLIQLKPELEGPLLGDKSNTVVFDNSKIKRLVPGFCASIRFDQGVRQSLSFLMKRPDLQIPDPEWDAWVDHVIALASPSAFSL